MYDKLYRWSGIIGITVLVPVIVAMLLYSWKKPLVYVQAADDNAAGLQESDAQAGPREFEELTPVIREGAENICIPVAGTVTQESIRIENDYTDHVITVAIDGMSLADLASDQVYGSLAGISYTQAADWDGRLILAVVTDNIYEYEAILENQKLTLTLKEPKELYERIVVLDAGHGGLDHGIEANRISESELTLDIAGRVRELLAAENIRVYVTRGAHDDPPGEKRIALANDAGADLFVSLHLAEGTDYGIRAFYDGVYFIPALTNVEFADLLVRETATAVNNRARGVSALGSGESGEAEAAEADPQAAALLYDAELPAVYLELGAPGNVREAALLGREDYRQDLAYGIYQAILKAYELAESR